MTYLGVSEAEVVLLELQRDEHLLSDDLAVDEALRDDVGRQDRVPVGHTCRVCVRLLTSRSYTVNSEADARTYMWVFNIRIFVSDVGMESHFNMNVHSL